MQCGDSQKAATEMHLCAIHGFLSANEEMVAGLFKLILEMWKFYLWQFPTIKFLKDTMKGNLLKLQI